MCGRFDQSQAAEKYLHALHWPTPIDAGAIHTAASPRFNVAPGMVRPVLHVVDEGRLQIDDVHWGYRAAWAEEKLPVTINTRLEKIGGRYWSHLLKRGRAIVAADGWYEWTGVKGDKQPWHIHRNDGEPVWMAALANFGAKASDHPENAGFTIVTADATGGMLDVHDRRPVVLGTEDVALWLDPDLPGEAAEQLARMRALPADAFAWHPVDRKLGNVRNDGPELIRPVAAPPPKPTADDDRDE